MAKVALITGGSRGIGAATARLAASRGYRICISYVSNEAAAKRVADDIGDKGGEAFIVQADTGSESDISRMFEAVDREAGRLDALVNNAGMTGPFGSLDSQRPEDIRRVLEVNLLGLILCCREALKRMSTKHGGRGGAIVNLASVAGREGAGGELTPYGASKGGVSTFTLGLAREVAAEGVRVNAILPGLIDTEMNPAERMARLVPTVPIKRSGTAEECAEAILWLLSDQASYVTGAVLPVTGGR